MHIPYKLMKVVWLDAQSSCDWTPIDSETQKLALCVSVGYLLMVDSDSITLATDFASSDREEIDSFGNSITIPKSCIVEQTEIE